MSIRPITPKEAKEMKASSIPSAIIEVFNLMLVEKYSQDGRIIIKQEEVIIRMLAALKEEGEGYSPGTRPYWYSASRQDIYDNNWLCIEPIFEKAGWNVIFDKPAYYETYEAHWVFTRK